MADLTTNAIALRGTPTGTEAAIVAAGTTVAELVTEASDEFQADVQPRYWPFPGVGDSIPTPKPVQAWVGYLARHKVYEILGRVNEIELSDDPSPGNLLALYNMKREDLIADPPRSQIPEIVVSGEAMTFGTTPLGTNDYKFDPGALGFEGFEVIPESVIVAGYQYLDDYTVDFSVKDRAWIFTRCNSAIVDTTAVQYRISFLRRREVDKPVSRTAGRFLRA